MHEHYNFQKIYKIIKTYLSFLLKLPIIFQYWLPILVDQRADAKSPIQKNLVDLASSGAKHLKITISGYFQYQLFQNPCAKVLLIFQNGKVEVWDFGRPMLSINK